MAQPIEAAGFFDRALELRPEHAPTLFYRSRAHERCGDFAAAHDDSTHALTQQPDCPLFYTLRAEITLRQADRSNSETRARLIQQAYADANHALELRPHYAEALLWRAHAAALQSELDDALHDATLALSLDATLTHSYAVRGMVRQQQADHANANEQAQRRNEALHDLNAALASGDEWAESFARRGCLLATMGEHEDAVMDFDRALAIRQNDPQILAWRGKSQANDRSKLNEAQQNFTDSLQVQPNQPDVLYERGCLLLATGDAKAAVRDLEAALRLRPGDTQAVAKLAEAKRRAGDMIGAVPHYWTQMGHWTRERLAR